MQITWTHNNLRYLFQVEVPKPYPVKVSQPVPVPYEVKVPVEVPRPYPVTVTKTVPYPVEKPVYVKVKKLEILVIQYFIVNSTQTHMYSKDKFYRHSNN